MEEIPIALMTGSSCLQAAGSKIIFLKKHAVGFWRLIILQRLTIITVIKRCSSMVCRVQFVPGLEVLSQPRAEPCLAYQRLIRFKEEHRWLIAFCYGLHLNTYSLEAERTVFHEPDPLAHEGFVGKYLQDRGYKLLFNMMISRQIAC
jgi:hypothetical protein